MDLWGRFPVVLVSGCQAMRLRGVAGLMAHGAGEVVQALEAEASFKADVVPGAGAVVVGAQEVLDVSEVLVDGEQWVAGPLSREERGVVWQAVLEVLDAVLEAVEELLPCLVVPVLRGAGAAEGVEEVLEDAEGGGDGLLRVGDMEEGVGEEGRLLVVAGRCGAVSHVLEELEAAPGEGGIAVRPVVAGEAGGKSREEEQERRGAAPQAGLWGLGCSHGGAVGAAWWALGRWLLRLGGGAGGHCAGGSAGWQLYVVPPRLPLPRFPLAASCRLWFPVWAGGCASAGEEPFLGWLWVGKSVAVLCGCVLAGAFDGRGFVVVVHGDGNARGQSLVGHLCCWCGFLWLLLFLCGSVSFQLCCAEFPFLPNSLFLLVGCSSGCGFLLLVYFIV